MKQDRTLVWEALRVEAGVDRLIVVQGSKDCLVRSTIATLSFPEDSTGELGLSRAVDLFDPSYRTRRLTDPHAVFEELTLELACEPQGHVVRLCGESVVTLQRTDQSFLRLWLLAARRKAEPDDTGGWVVKTDLEIGERDHDLEKLRGALRTAQHGVPKVQRAALIKSNPDRSRSVRLALPAANISLDSSLSLFELLNKPAASAKRRVTPGAKKHQDDLSLAAQISSALLHRIQRIG